MNVTINDTEIQGNKYGKFLFAVFNREEAGIELWAADSEDEVRELVWSKYYREERAYFFSHVWNFDMGAQLIGKRS